MLKKHPAAVRIVFKNYPLRSHRYALKAAEAALAAGHQGKFWEFHDELFKDYRGLNEEKIVKIAGKLGLDQARFQRDRKDPEIAARVKADYDEGKEIGLRGVPALFVNGRRLTSGDLRKLDEIIEKEKAGKGK